MKHPFHSIKIFVVRYPIIDIVYDRYGPRQMRTNVVLKDYAGHFSRLDGLLWTWITLLRREGNIPVIKTMARNYLRDFFIHTQYILRGQDLQVVRRRIMFSGG